MKPRDLFLLLGTNLGDRLTHLIQARDELSKVFGNSIKSSRVYRSEPWGVTNQPEFYNQVLIYSSLADPNQVLQEILSIEQRMGRVRAQKWGPRVIDIDILLYGDLTIDTTELTIPHPAIQDRRFVLTLLDEIAAEVVHPVLGRSIHHLLADCPDDGKVQALEA